MVDNIRIQFLYDFNRRKFDKNFILKGIFYDEKTGTEFKKYAVVNPNNGERIYLTTSSENKYCFLTGSWRRWYFGKNQSFLGDFNKSQFKKLIFLLAKIINVKPGALWSAEVKKVELGFNTKLKREHELFINSLKKYGKLKKKIIDCETVEFFGTKKSFICYDKCTRLNKVLKNRQMNKLKSRFLFLRCELKIKDKSASKYKREIDTVFSIFKNWDFLLGEIYQIIKNRIEKIDLFSEDLDLTKNLLKWGEQKDLLFYQGVKSSGFDNALLLIEKRSKDKTKVSKSRGQLFQIYNKHKSCSGGFLINEIYEEMYQKVSRMRF